MELITSTIEGIHDREIVIEPFESHGVLVPRGFIFDGASTPRAFWWLIPPFKQTKKASCIHDFQCREARKLEDLKEYWKKRSAADRLFEVMLREAGISWLRAKLGLIGVTLGTIYTTIRRGIIK